MKENKLDDALNSIIEMSGEVKTVVEDGMKKLIVDFTWVEFLNEYDTYITKINLVASFKCAKEYFVDALIIKDAEHKDILIYKNVIKPIVVGSFTKMLELVSKGGGLVTYVPDDKYIVVDLIECRYRKHFKEELKEAIATEFKITEDFRYKKLKYQILIIADTDQHVKTYTR